MSNRQCVTNYPAYSIKTEISIVKAGYVNISIWKGRTTNLVILNGVTGQDDVMLYCRKKFTLQRNVAKERIYYTRSYIKLGVVQ